MVRAFLAVVLLLLYGGARAADVEESRLVVALQDHLNSRPQTTGILQDGSLISSSKNENIYAVVADFKINCNDGTCSEDKVKCQGSIEYSNEKLIVLDDETKCEPPSQEDKTDTTSTVEVSPIEGLPEIEITESEPVNLAHEIQMNDQFPGSGEQFVAIRRDSAGGEGWCAGCPIDISLTADGVSDLANYAILHLDVHLPKEKHVLRKIARVQRQAQIVNGVRYIILVEVDTVPCSKKDEEQTNDCSNSVPSTAICQVSFLEKPWLKFSDGTKFRSVLSNNCTQEYNFGDDGEPVSSLNPNRSPDDIVKVALNQLQTVQKVNNQEITPERIQAVEEQIIVDPMQNNEDTNQLTVSHLQSHEVDKKIVKEEVNPIASEPQININEPSVATEDNALTTSNRDVATELSNDKRQALDGLMDIFGFDQPIIPIRQQTSILNTENTEKKPEKNNSSDESNSSNSSQEKTPVKTRSKRSLFAPKKNKNEIGGNEIKELAKYALQTLDEYDSDDIKRVVLQVLDFKTSQRNHSMFYFITFNAGLSKCLESHSDNDHCAGMLINGKTKICNVEIELLPDKSKKVNKAECAQNGIRIKRRPENIVGGSTPVTLPDDEITDLAKLSVDHYNLNSPHSNRHAVVNILSATRQVVAGQLTEIKLEIKETDCSKNQPNTEKCKFLQESISKMCTASIWSRPWLNKNEITIDCEPSESGKKRSKRQVAGGVSPVTLPDPKITELAEMVVNHYDLSSEYTNRHGVVNILSATRQVVAGSLTKIEIEIKEIDCLKNQVKTPDCKFLEGKNVKRCTASIWSRPWLNKNEITVDCDPNESTKKRSKRQIPGGAISVILPDPKITELAKLSVNHYDLTSQNNKRHNIVNILSATRQVVAGLLTNIEIEIREVECGQDEINNEDCKFLEGTESKRCTAEVWSKSWLNKNDININCVEGEISTKTHSQLKPVQKLEDLLKKENKFMKFMNKYSKSYSNDHDEYNKRFKIFCNNLDLIENLNTEELGTGKYGVNQFADLSQEEFKKQYLGLRPDLFNENLIPMPQAMIPNLENVPDSIDWRDKGAVTPVKNQESCGSCWAFSVTGNIEGQNQIKNGKLLSLSEQELVDCDKLDEGCNGGLPDNAYRAIEQLGGLELENDYPYDAKDEKCSFNKTLARVQISGAVNISSDETEMMNWLAANGPISIGINANAMQFYVGGVSHPPKFLCSPKNLDHGVLIVGYGMKEYPIFKKKMPYWIVKNSWGTSWGERGYYRVYRGDGTCGLNLMASSAVL